MRNREREARYEALNQIDPIFKFWRFSNHFREKLSRESYVQPQPDLAPNCNS